MARRPRSRTPSRLRRASAPVLAHVRPVRTHNHRWPDDGTVTCRNPRPMWSPHSPRSLRRPHATRGTTSGVNAPIVTGRNTPDAALTPRGPGGDQNQRGSGPTDRRPDVSLGAAAVDPAPARARRPHGCARSVVVAQSTASATTTSSARSSPPEAGADRHRPPVGRTHVPGARRPGPGAARLRCSSRPVRRNRSSGRTCSANTLVTSTASRWAWRSPAACAPRPLPPTPTPTPPDTSGRGTTRYCYGL